MSDGPIVLLDGSLGGARGNTCAVLAPLLGRLRERAHVVEVHLAAGEGDPGALERLLLDASGFVFATGTYWDSWGSPLQVFLERATRFEASRVWLGKPAAVVITAHSVGGKDVLSRLQGVLGTLGLAIPPMTGFVYSLAVHAALRAHHDGDGRRADFWQLGDLDVVADNLLEAVSGGRAYRAWAVDGGDPSRAWMTRPDAEAPLGSQTLADLYECDPNVLDDVDRVRDAMLEAARRAGATIVGHAVHRFSPQGVSGVVVIAESHLAVHTWPEHRYAALDLFTCGATIRQDACFDHLRAAFASRRHTTTRVPRGHRASLRPREKP